MSGWLDIKDAPAGVHGLVWSPRAPNRTDLVGLVFEYPDGERFISCASANLEFTHWHKLPDPPVQKET